MALSLSPSLGGVRLWCVGEKTQAWQNEALLYPSALHRSHCEMTMSSLLVNRQSFQGQDVSVEPDSVPSTGVVLGLQL